MSFGDRVESVEPPRHVADCGLQGGLTGHAPRATFHVSRITHLSADSSAVALAKADHASRITHHRRPLAALSTLRSAFTLMEIMIVVGIMGIILTMSVPIVWKIWHRPPMNQALHDIMTVCSNGRAFAILQSREVDLIIHPRDGRFDLVAAASPAQNSNPTNNSAAFASQPAPVSLSGSGLSAQLDRVIIEDLDINKIPGGFRDAEQARVRFFPNGTADEMSLFLLADTGQRCEILLEVTTGLTSVEWEVRKFR